MPGAENRLEPAGCALAFLRLAGCSVLLWVIMLIAILAAGFFFKIFF